MADVGDLDRDRPAVGSAAQSDRAGGHDDETERGRSACQKLAGFDVVGDETADRVGDDDDDGEADEGEKVDAVGDVVPLGVAEPVLRARATEFS